jgi:dTDP-4-amino-4,6-dideoxygalactose transaminase
MDKIMALADRHKLVVVEDAAQAVMAKYKGRYLGTIGELGTYSFHETKNYTMGEGGALLINHANYIERAEIIREKGTNRSNFLRGQVDKYTWVDIGSSYLPSDILAAYLYPQLEIADQILEDRLSTWNLYYQELKELTHVIELPYIPEYAQHNAHMFYIKVRDIEERTALIAHLANDGIQAVFHYVPLHSSPAGLKYGKFHGVDHYTTKESERLLRLPIYYQMDPKDVLMVCDSIKRYFDKLS